MDDRPQKEPRDPQEASAPVDAERWEVREERRDRRIDYRIRDSLHKNIIHHYHQRTAAQFGQRANV